MITPISISFGYYNRRISKFVIVEEIPIASTKEVADYIIFFHNKYDLDSETWASERWDIAIHVPSNKTVHEKKTNNI